MQKIVLNKGKKGQFALVDDEDYDYLSQYSWHINSSGYVLRSDHGKNHRMHREVMKASRDMEIDHINRDKLDNRKANLRVSTRNQNEWNKGLKKTNKSGYKGVHWAGGAWRARITYQSKPYYLGRFRDVVKAAHAYNKKAEELFGEFAYLNNIKG